MSNLKNPRIFISYAWGGESESLVSQLEKVFKDKSADLVRDKTNGLGFKGLIKEFMQQIGRGNFVIAIISDKYLKSKNCMYELLEIHKNGNFYNRIFPLVLNDAKIYEAEDIIDYTEYWDDKIEKLEEKIKVSKRLSNLTRVHRDLDLYVQIRSTLDQLLDILSNMNTFTTEFHQSEGFETLINTILNQIKTESESSKNVSFGGSANKVQTELIEGIEMVLVEGGSYYMGYKPDRDGRDEDMIDAKPLHKVNLDSYFIGKFLVTQEQWQNVMGKNPSYFKDSVYNPVENICWFDSIKFIEELNQKGKYTFRLPTEAEWEFAARGGNFSKENRFAGDNDLEKVAWYGNNASKQSHSVGGKLPNELGIYDMCGNVWEWCNDWYDAAYYTHSPELNPKGPQTGKCKVLRGSSWYDFKNLTRIAIRYKLFPKARYFDIGLRLAMDYKDN